MDFCSYPVSPGDSLFLFDRDRVIGAITFLGDKNGTCRLAVFGIHVESGREDGGAPLQIGRLPITIPLAIICKLHRFQFVITRNTKGEKSHTLSVGGVTAVCGALRSETNLEPGQAYEIEFLGDHPPARVNVQRVERHNILLECNDDDISREVSSCEMFRSGYLVGFLVHIATMGYYLWVANAKTINQAGLPFALRTTGSDVLLTTLQSMPAIPIVGRE